jgi:ubiquinone/menaquinone biosynthesis C-methylase UbiE
MFPINLEKYPLPELDQMRVADLIRLIPKDGETALDAGALWGYFSEYLSSVYPRVTALDLQRPTWELPGVTTVAGDITRLQFPDNSFDLVFCAEVLEHIPDYRKAAAELARVARRHVVIGVPLEQDLRIGRLDCVHCGRVNPPYGHVNSFTEGKLKSLFPSLRVEATSFVYEHKQQRTNELSRLLYDFARNPYGDYDRLEPCMYCDRKLERPANRTLVERACSFLAYRLDKVQNLFSPVRPGWIHVVFSKNA